MKIEITVDESTGETNCTWTWEKLGHAGYPVAIQKTIECSAAILGEFKTRVAEAIAVIATQPVAVNETQPTKKKSRKAKGNK